MTHPTRRQALKRTGAWIAAPAAAAAWLSPQDAQAAWPKDAFDAKTTKEALAVLYPGATPQTSSAVTILAPELAENGTVVPVTVQSTLPNIQTITMLADGNPRALVATFTLSKRAQAPVTVRMKLAKSQDIVAVAKAADGKTYIATRPIRVSIGGCGG